MPMPMLDPPPLVSPQGGVAWCVPAGVAAVMNYGGAAVSDEDLVWAYLENGDRIQLSPNQSPVPGTALGANRAGALARARNVPLIDASFGKFATLGARFALPRAVKVIDDHDPLGWNRQVRQAIDEGSPAALSIPIGANAHIVVAFGYDDDFIYYCDPQRPGLYRLANGDRHNADFLRLA